MSIQPLFTGNHQAQEPIPGYQLLELIGRGGYGEVWKTLAPGGVPKAIKLIFGNDSSRLKTELAAINRVKDVRHPFLLSIERIEQHGEMLAIVTELGDKNLQQYFEELRAKQQPGIPQNELLGMMRDVADVLDYLYQEYALQHLDIKPANLLLFGKRLKVADFGLMKNLYERSASLVHGLTPTYAAPEIFEGRPTRTSDQYSLAILYQEMLTGVLPFNGVTAARLATQHLREPPDLSSLPPSLRPAIARALSKDPQRRYPSCTELVEELLAASRRSTTDVGAGRSQAPSESEATGKKPPTRAGSETPSTSIRSIGVTGEATNANAAAVTSIPTVVIGIGGSAGKAIQNLRLRIADRMGGTDKMRALKILFFDVDHEALSEINDGQQGGTGLETVATPLCTSAEYCEARKVHRRWLSRRWLFNVPRTLQTDGLRPFGRLALLSNASRALGAIRSAIQQVTSANPGIQPRILVVASISGGTGSGMVMDMAYAARQELRNAGFVDACVDGVLLHSMPIGQDRGKAILNAVAALTELQHFSAPGSFYPGEPLLHIPPIHGDNAVFASTQLLHLGEELDGPGWLHATDNVAEHLYCRLVTNVDQATDTPKSHLPSGHRLVDLVQVHQIGGYSGPFIDELSHQLSLDVVNGWCGLETRSQPDDTRTLSTNAIPLDAKGCRPIGGIQQLTAEAEAQVVACGVDIASMIDRARELLQQEIAMSPQQFLMRSFAEARNSSRGGLPDHELASVAVTLQDRVIGLDFGERPADQNQNTLYESMKPRLTSQAMPIASKLVGWICDLVDHPTGGIDAARSAAEAARNCIRDLTSGLRDRIQERQLLITKMRIKLTTPAGADLVGKKHLGWLSRRPDPHAMVSGKVIELGLFSFNELLDRLVYSQLHVIETNVSIVLDQLIFMDQGLKQLAKRMGNEFASATSGTESIQHDDRSLSHRLLEVRHRLATELRNGFEQSVLEGPKKLQRFLWQRCSFDEVLGDPLKTLARQVVLRRINQMLCTALDNRSDEGDCRGMNVELALTKILSEPWRVDGGTDERTLLIIPASAIEAAANMTLPPDVSVMPAETNTIAVYRERQHLTISEVIASLTRGQATLVDVAANLHTRIDVNWQERERISQSAEQSEPPLGEWVEGSHTVPLNTV